MNLIPNVTELLISKGVKMVTLGDLLDIIWRVTELNVTAYDNSRLQHEWILPAPA